MIKLKVDIIAELVKVGYNPARIRKENLIGQATLTNFRKGNIDNMTIKTLDVVCRLLDCEISDIIEYSK